MPDPATPLDEAQVKRFLALLGKDPATARFRAFPHKDNPHRTEIGARKGPFDLQAFAVWQVQGRGIYVVINDGGDTKASITSCRAFFCEWDDRPISEQLNAWRTLGLGEPTFIVLTGGKSAHLYWVLKDPIAPDQWAPVQAALIKHAAGDEACKDASRVMRLPGAFYVGPDGQPLGRTVITATAGHLYTLEQVLAWLPSNNGISGVSNLRISEVRASGTAGHQRIELHDPAPAFADAPRSLDQVKDALASIPPILPKTGQRETFRAIAWGLLGAVREAGGTDALALQLLEAHSPAVTDAAEYLQSEPHTIRPSTLWYYARQHGWRPQEEPHQQAPRQPGTTTPEPLPGPLLTIQQVRSQLAAAVADGASRSDLEVLLIELGAAGDFNPAALRGLLRSIEQEHEAAHSIAAETRGLREAADWQDVGASISLHSILPPSVAAALRTRCTALPTDDVSALMPFLVTISSLLKLGSEVIASKAADYRVPLNLYAALVARSGAKKSPVSRLLVTAPTTTIRQELARNHTRALQDWTEQNRNVKPSERPDPPRAVFVSISDTTAEALASQLQAQEARGMALLLHRDELAGMFGSLNAYRSGRGGDEEQLLEAYDGSGFLSLRVAATGGGRFYDRCQLSVWGTIQPAVLERLVANGDASGLWARFMFIPLPERVVPISATETIDQRDAAEDAALKLSTICRHVYQLRRSSFELTSDARRAFVAYEERCQHDALSAIIPAQGALWGKAPGKALRVAALLHVIHQVATDGARSPLVEVQTIRDAATIVDHVNSWTMSLHASVQEGGATQLMRTIHRVAQTHGGVATVRDITQGLSRAQRKDVDAANIASAMQALADLGAGDVEIGKRGAVRFLATGRLP
jgi:hypothetical protein